MGDRAELDVGEVIVRYPARRERSPGLHDVTTDSEDSSSRRPAVVVDVEKGSPMSADAEAVSWPEGLDDPDDEGSGGSSRRILHVRHRVGDYDVTRLILGANSDSIQQRGEPETRS